ncbi:MAG TPA: hypothetical protein VLA83_18255 [Candidatus Binatia bacterium]|nr:hypothetical protein [Candidatus Binatia bacterium]
MTIRPILSGALCLLCFLPFRGQQTDAPTEESNLYARALSATADEMEKSWGEIDDTCCIRSLRETRIRTNYRDLIVEKYDLITEGLPARFGDHEIEYLDVGELSARYHKLHKEFAVLRIHPMRNSGSSLKIYIGVYWFSSNKDHVVFAFSDWSNVEFRYDCENRKWVINEVKLGGI